MNRLNIDKLRPYRRRSRLGRRLWREWCFGRAVLRQFKGRMALILGILVAGTLLFQRFDPAHAHDLGRAFYSTFSLIFAQPAAEFPQSAVLRVLFFVIPLLGITVIIESIVDFALMMRDRRRHERNWCSVMAASMKNHIVLVGFGRLGFRSFRLLHRLGQDVVVIERDPQNEYLEEARHAGAPILIGDARHDAVLRDSNIGAARSIILATNDDLANLEVALDARKVQPDIRVVLRMFDQNMADKVRAGFNIHIAMSQSALSAPAFAMAALEREITGSYVVGDRLIVMLRWTLRAGGPLAGRTVGEVLSTFGFSVVELVPRDGPRRLFPVADTPLAAGDEVLVQGPLDTLAPLLKQLRAAAA